MNIIQSNNKKENSPNPTGEQEKNVQQHGFREHILQRTELYLEQLKDKSAQREEEMMVYLLSGTLIIIGIAAIIKWGVFWRLLPILFLLAYLIYFRMQMIQVTKAALKVKLPSLQEFKYDSVWLKSKVSYLLSGTEVKLSRLKYICWLYFLFCPWLLYFTFELFKEPPSGIYLLASILFAYLIGGVFWLFFFRGDVEEIEKTQQEFKRYLENL